MFNRLSFLLLAAAPLLSPGQPAAPAPGAPVPNNPAANLPTVSTLRTNMVGGGVRIKDLTFIAGARPNQLTGFGVVVGLNNTGDKDTVYSKQSLANMFKQFGVSVPPTSVSSKNSAAVMVTANLPPFLKSGSRIDVTVSAAGDATSLTGGSLISTPMLGPDGRVYAVAQGPVNNNAFALGTDAAVVMKNHPTAGQVVNGAIVEKEVKVTLLRNNQIRVILRDSDFTLAARMTAAINAQSQRLGGRGFIARALDGNAVLVNVPEQFRAAPIDFIAHLHAIEVVPDSKAVVVMNEKTGTIVATSRVRVLSCAIAHGNIFLQVTSEKDVIQPPPLAPAAATTTTVNRDTVKVTENGGGLNVFAEMPTVQEVARALNSLGATPRDMMSIFQELKSAKALQADLIVK